MRTLDRAFQLFICLVGFAVLCQSRVVKVPVGPLLSVEGQSVSIRCNVSEYQGPLEQDFEWSLLVNGKDEVRLISTFDPSFPDKSVLDRVNSGDISVGRLGDAEAQLVIKKVRATDSTIYRCTTPSTDTIITGNTYADVELKVIGDTLKVNAAIPKPAVSEGKSVELNCNVTRAYTAHTVLSVTWSVKKAGSSLEEILTFGPDSELKVGQGSAQRYADGELLLKLSGDSYGLTLKGVRPQDQGTYVCTAREWARQPGGGKGWQKILDRSVEMGNLAVTPIAQSLVVSVEKKTTLSVDETLNLTCSVAANDLSSLGLEVTWLVGAPSGSGNPRVLLRVGRDGQLLEGSEQAGMSRVQPGTFRLLLQKVQPSDSGLYSCLIKAWLPKGSGGWYDAANKASDPVEVLIKQLEPEFKVSLTAPVTPQFTADPTELLCEATDLLNLQDGRLGVTWSYTKNTPGDASQSATIIASLNERGVLVPGGVYQQRLEKGDIAVSRSGPDTFKIRLLHTQDEDMGFYTCIIAAWTHGRQDQWNKAKEVASTPVAVQWTTKTPVVSVVAHRVREASTGGSTFEMSCQVTGQNLQNPGYSVLIRCVNSQGGKARKIISLNADSVLQLEEGMVHSRADSVALEKTGQLEYRFRLCNAQDSDRGSYYCDVTAWTRDPRNEWNKAVSAESNKIEIAFADTAPVFNISLKADSLNVLHGDTAKIECVMSVPSNIGDVAYDVSWFQSPSTVMENSVPLISVDHWGVVKKSGGNESAHFSLERLDKGTFVLTVHHIQDRDMGEYYCKAKLWYLSTATKLWNEGQEHTSNPVFLSIKLELWNSIKTPLLYGLGAALIVGILSVLIGYLTSHFCISRSPMHTPRNKLIDLEMD
ncbi:prostaglandin F2 receptor negative regulator-like [Trichomycterus rosablanca]|uniref:prostaglandin F2 receptor negative regulator-like n=1 Tax=Trichomycterus rosablanca TaxID=2290929 RepID=UPI002F35EAA3